MALRRLENKLETFDWTNPDTGQKIKLGEQAEKDIFINPEYISLDLIKLLSLSRIGDYIGQGSEGQVYLYDDGCRKMAIKKYKMPGSSGISQFRCLRKIRLLGFEAPEVYAASEETLVMDYVPHNNLAKYLFSLKDEKKASAINRLWIEFMRRIESKIYEETLDSSISNGYIKPTANGSWFGVLDQG